VEEAASASISGRGVHVRPVAAAASASTGKSGAGVRPVAAAASASISVAGAIVSYVVVEASASISECGAGVKPAERYRTRRQKTENDEKETRKRRGECQPTPDATNDCTVKRRRTRKKQKIRAQHKTCHPTNIYTYVYICMYIYTYVYICIYIYT